MRDYSEIQKRAKNALSWEYSGEHVHHYGKVQKLLKKQFLWSTCIIIAPSAFVSKNGRGRRFLHFWGVSRAIMPLRKIG